MPKSNALNRFPLAGLVMSRSFARSTASIAATRAEFQAMVDSDCRGRLRAVVVPRGRRLQPNLPQTYGWCSSILVARTSA